MMEMMIVVIIILFYYVVNFVLFTVLSSYFVDIVIPRILSIFIFFHICHKKSRYPYIFLYIVHIADILVSIMLFLSHIDCFCCLDFNHLNY